MLRVRDLDRRLACYVYDGPARRQRGIFRFGDAGFYGSTGALFLRAPIVGMASSPSSHGYWLVASDGGIFRFGDAVDRGNAVGRGLVGRAIVGMAATPSGHGYWIASAGKLALRPVFVVGDSLTVGAAPYIPGAFAANEIPLVGISGKVGRHTSEGTGVLAGAIADGTVGPNTTIVGALGTNDYGSASGFASQVDQFLAVAGRRRVVWVNIAFHDGRDAQAVALNAQLARTSRLQVADWHSLIAGHDDWWAGDGTHLNGTATKRVRAGSPRSSRDPIRVPAAEAQHAIEQRRVLGNCNPGPEQSFGRRLRRGHDRFDVAPHRFELAVGRRERRAGRAREIPTVKQHLT